MSGYFESVRWNACVQRLDLGFSLIRKSFGGMESGPMLTPREKIPSTGGSEEDRTRDAASRRTASPTHYRLSYSGPSAIMFPLTVWKYRNAVDSCCSGFNVPVDHVGMYQ